MAIRCKDGVVFGVEKLMTSKLYEPGTGKRIFNIDTHVGMAVAGLISDARQIVSLARDEAAYYRSVYGTPIPVKYLADRIAGYVHAYTLYSAYRPFGCSVLIGSFDKADGAELFMIEPSGVFYGFHGVAVGKAKQNAKTEVEKLKLENMTCREAVKEISRIIYVVHDEVKDKAFELELSWVGSDTEGLHKMVPREIATEAEELAKKSLEEDSDSDNEL